MSCCPACGRPRPESKCTGCGKPRPEGAWRKSWVGDRCGTCYKRWIRHGRPADGPPPPTPRAPRAKRLARIEDYTELRSWGVPKQQAAERLGVSVRTVERYKRDLSEAS